MTVVRVALPLGVNKLFDYWLPPGLAAEPGIAVRIKLGKRTLVGIVAGISTDSDISPERLQPVLDVATGLPKLPPDCLQLGFFISEYYHQPLGLVLRSMLPPERAALASPISLVAPLGLSETGKLHFQDAVPRADVPQRLLAELRTAGVSEIRLPELSAYARRYLVQWARAGWIKTDSIPAIVTKHRPNVELNAAQRDAVQAIVSDADRFACSLLLGITGSGKTEVYLEAALAMIARGGQVLVLVPEINLTPQLEERVRRRLSGVRTVTLHSRLSPRERRFSHDAAASGKAQLVLGTRLAVFTPMPTLALIVVDEEHDISYKQQDGARYHARDVAIYRASQRGIPIVLGSATPSLESYSRARSGRYQMLRLPMRAPKGALPPAIRLVPHRQAGAVEGIGVALQAAIAARLERKEQALVFINRRGYSPSLMCKGCGWRAMCLRCSARLVVHQESKELRCHHCAATYPMVRACPDCGNQDLLPVGLGTQRLERALRTLFPTARVLRIDSDSTRQARSFPAMLADIHRGDADILVGTQMLAKGHDFRALTLVGVLGADNALYSADFRATERLFAQLLQVAGRAGRFDVKGEVLIQTDFADHDVYQSLISQDFDAFADKLLAEREIADWPPWSRLALLRAEAHQRSAVDAFLEHAFALGETLVSEQNNRCTVFPPVQPSLSRLRGYERGQLLVQSRDRGALQEFLAAWYERLVDRPLRGARWHFDVDPVDLA